MGFEIYIAPRRGRGKKKGLVVRRSSEQSFRATSEALQAIGADEFVQVLIDREDCKARIVACSKEDFGARKLLVAGGWGGSTTRVACKWLAQRLPKGEDVPCKLVDRALEFRILKEPTTPATGRLGEPLDSIGE